MPDRLIEQATRLENSLKELTSTLSKVERRSHVARVLGAIGILVGVIGLIVGVTGVTAARDANHSVDVSDASRTEARIAACNQDSRRVDGLHQAFDLSIRALVPPGQALTPEQQEFLARYNQAVVMALPPRDCTPEGITAYYSEQPATTVPTPVTT